MSTEVTEQGKIDDMNELIAIFDGWEKVLRGKVECFTKMGHRRYHYDLKYHEDWNQIHAVWDRFKNLKISEVDEGFNDKYSRHLQAISTALHAFPITTVHIRLYNAIQWHQSVKK